MNGREHDDDDDDGGGGGSDGREGTVNLVDTFRSRLGVAW